MAKLGTEELKEWVSLHAQLVQADKSYQSSQTNRLFDAQEDEKRESLLSQLNERIYDLLEIGKMERYLIEDLVHHRLQFNKGKFNRELMSPPAQTELQIYAEILRSELNDFLGDEGAYHHRVCVYTNRDYAALEISLTDTRSSRDLVQVREVEGDLADSLSQLQSNLRRNHGQWLYFDRNLTIFDGSITYLFKPMQKLHWLRSQALVDADDLIADTLAAGGNHQPPTEMLAAGNA